MGEQLLPESFFVAFLLPFVFAATAATFSCSNSFQFDQLCPDPRFGSGGNALYDTSIHLDSGPGVGAMQGNPSYSRYISSITVKEPSTTSCDFHRNGTMETAVVTAVHASRIPWIFRHSKNCTHIVKFSYALFKDRDGSGGMKAARNEKVCEKEIGIRRNTDNMSDDLSSSSSHEQIGPERDELLSKRSVVFWHNFTLLPHSARYVDTLTNYHLSRDEVVCSSPHALPNYVQIAVIVSKGGQCEVLVQQYKIEEDRSPYGCRPGASIPFPIQFCGSYDCSQSISILTRLKLLARRATDQQPSDRNRTGLFSTKRHRHRTATQSSSWNGSQLGPSEWKSKDGGDEDDKVCITEGRDETTTAAYKQGDDEHQHEEEGEVPSMDWSEAVFLFGFPACGVIFILLVLYILRNRTSKDICRGYPYQQRRHVYADTIMKNPGIPPPPQTPRRHPSN